MNVLLCIIQSDGEVFPLSLHFCPSPHDLVILAQDLPVVLLGESLPSDQSASLEVELIAVVVGSLVPDIDVLVRSVQLLRSLSDTPMESLDTNGAGISTVIGGWNETCSAESVLRFAAGAEDGLVVDHDLYWLATW